MRQLDEFIKEVESEGLYVEGIAVADGDSVLAEHHFVPNRRPRCIYSHTKSYTSVAIGMAIDDMQLTIFV